MTEFTLLNNSDPDYFIEDFWLGFKQSMVNFYRIIDIENLLIPEWSYKLNKLKNEKKYDDIECNIRNYISLYSYDLIKYSKSIYHDEILITNIKRWNNISKQFNFESEEYNKILLFFLINLELKKDKEIKEEIKNYFNQKSIEETIKNNLFDNYICFALLNEKVKILEYLKNVPKYNLLDNIIRLYPKMNFKNKNNIKFNKLCKMFKKLY